MLGAINVTLQAHSREQTRMDLRSERTLSRLLADGCLRAPGLWPAALCYGRDLLSVQPVSRMAYFFPAELFPNIGWV